MVATPIDDKAIFEVACQIESSDARAAYLRQVCGDHEAVHDRIVSLLRLHEEQPGFLESPPGDLSPPSIQSRFLIPLLPSTPPPSPKSPA